MNPPLFTTLPGSDSNPRRLVTFEFEGRAMTAPAGTTVAAALMQNQVLHFRDSPVSGEPRAPYCQMGICFECLVQINGVQNRQSCMTVIEDGMQVRMQQGQTVFSIVESGDPA